MQRLWNTSADPLREIRSCYGRCDYLMYAERLERAVAGDFPPFVLELQQRERYIARLKMMAKCPELPRHIQALNALKLLDRGQQPVGESGREFLAYPKK